ncbi:MAG: S-layer homology domain-containing protein [Defluviitaleaceae bacterium]|nr:S-layer homology domain-containing protein [Defluviitaleaceae bacterium]
MKQRIAISLLLMAIMIFSSTLTVFGRVGQIGFFGGITEGVRLPLTTEIILQQATTGNQPNLNLTNMVYTEIIWIGGIPIEFEGLMNMNVSNARGRGASAYAGTRTVRYFVRPGPLSPEGVAVNRDITFNINWRREGNQIIETYSVARWIETIVIGDTTFTLDPDRSSHEISIIRDITPGVIYYSGVLSKRAVFVDGEGQTTTHTLMGQIYGFESAWSAVETHRLTGIVDTGVWQLQYQQVPSVAVSKELQYRVNEPTLISFAGNYREVTNNLSGLNYVINIAPTFMHDISMSGSATISNFNRFEQLIAPNLNSIRGHWAYQDIRRLFAMEIITGNPDHFVPNQAITRAEFMTMLARAVKLPLDEAHMTAPVQRGNRPLQVQLVFPDLWPNRPDYAYLRAINEAGIAVGRGDGHFHPDQQIWRQEAYVLALRTLGLGRLSLDMPPVSIFADSDQISDWAMNDIQAATRIGLIAPDENGNLNPQEYMTKAQAAALINRLIEYMRHELIRDYTENIINFMN